MSTKESNTTISTHSSILNIASDLNLSEWSEDVLHSLHTLDLLTNETIREIKDNLEFLTQVSIHYSILE
jgi:hypothetical protein